MAGSPYMASEWWKMVTQKSKGGLKRLRLSVPSPTSREGSGAETKVMTNE